MFKRGNILQTDSRKHPNNNVYTFTIYFGGDNEIGGGAIIFPNWNIGYK